MKFIRLQSGRECVSTVEIAKLSQLISTVQFAGQVFSKENSMKRFIACLTLVFISLLAACGAAPEPTLETASTRTITVNTNGGIQPVTSSLIISESYSSGQYIATVKHGSRITLIGVTHGGGNIGTWSGCNSTEKVGGGVLCTITVNRNTTLNFSVSRSPSGPYPNY